jgi:hypothetical protein
VHVQQFFFLCQKKKSIFFFFFPGAAQNSLRRRLVRTPSAPFFFFSPALFRADDIVLPFRTVLAPGAAVFFRDLPAIRLRPANLRARPAAAPIAAATPAIADAPTSRLPAMLGGAGGQRQAGAREHGAQFGAKISGFGAETSEKQRVEYNYQSKKMTKKKKKNQHTNSKKLKKSIKCDT